MHRLLDLSRDAAHPHGISAVLVVGHGRSPVQVVCAFCALFCLISALAIPGCSVLALGAEAVFGVLGGTLAVVLASAAGASLSFAVARRYARPVFRRRYATRLAAIDRGPARDGDLYLFAPWMASVIRRSTRRQTLRQQGPVR